ncbi:MAG TPA: iron-containing alcohol dehydrogenase [Kiloniellaceae bacterium]|nr:iron-containing alcohol dehydrogenase [Kiloniellaceae bacterium]
MPDNENTTGLAYGFQTVFGRNLVEELNNFVHRPFLVVTMSDLWPLFESKLSTDFCQPYFVRSVAEADLLMDLEKLPMCEAIVGLGGGQALDVAKYFSWKGRLPLFQLPTALSVNAVYGQRCGLRVDGRVRYLGWAVPESVFIDYDVIRSAPRQMNYSGIGDILCFHTGVLDWRYASERGQCESKWPYDADLAAQSLAKVEAVLRHQDDIRDLTDKGIDVLVDGLKWGTSYHGAGWMPRHIEGIDHFVFYALEHVTGQKFLHGQPVCLGVYIGSLLHDARGEEMLSAIHSIGLDIRPEAMGITWEQVSEGLLGLRGFVRQEGLWHSIAHDTDISPAFVERLRGDIEGRFGPWDS